MAQSGDIRTERLCITPFAVRHLTGRYVGWLNDRELMRYSEQRHRQHTLESCRAYRQSFEGTPNYFWAIEEVAAGLGHIGNLNAYVDPNNLLADLGIVIGEPGARGKGYALEAWLAVIGFLFRETGTRKVTAGCMAVNEPMLRVMEQAGMKPDGVRRRHYLCDCEEVGIVYSALFREDWKTEP